MHTHVNTHTHTHTHTHTLTLPPSSLLKNDDVSRVARGAKIMERMVNQNTFDDIAQGVQESIPFHLQHALTTVVCVCVCIHTCVCVFEGDHAMCVDSSVRV